MDGSAPLTVALEIIRGQVLTGFGLIQGDVYAIYNTLLLVSGLLAIFAWFFEGRPKAAIGFMAKFVSFVILASILQNFRLIIETIYGAAVELGLKAGGSSLAPGDFFDPGAIALAGLTAVKPLREHVRSLLGWYDWLPNAPEIVFYLAIMLIMIACFVVIALQVFLTVLEFLVLSLACFIVGPWAVLNRTAFVAERAMGYVVATAVKLLVLAIIFAVSEAILMGFRWSEEPAIDEALGIFALTLAICLIAWRGPHMAAGMINGGPVFNAGDALSSLVSAARIVGGVGAAAVGAAKPALKAGAAGIRAGLHAMGGEGRGGGAQGLGYGPADSTGTGGGNGGVGAGSPSRGLTTLGVEAGAAERYARGLSGWRAALEPPTIETSYERV